MRESHRAMLDRFLEHIHVFTITGRRYRLRSDLTELSVLLTAQPPKLPLS